SCLKCSGVSQQGKKYYYEKEMGDIFNTVFGFVGLLVGLFFPLAMHGSLVKILNFCSNCLGLLKA
ncbi:hypothetical protein Q8G81_35105, partial [Klebsiella pneumoniae]